MPTKMYAIFGASGFGREVMPLARDQLGQGKCPEVVFVDDNPPASHINGHRVLSYGEYLESISDEKYISIAIADSRIRENLTSRCVADGLRLWNIVASNAMIMDEVFFESAAVLCPFSTITSNVRIGHSFHANIYSYVAHDCVIGDYVTFAPSVKCNGNVVIEDHAYIGTGAIIKQGKPGRPIVIGEGAVVGMGAVVTKSVPPGSVVIGNPAKPLSKKGLRGTGA